MNYRIPKGAKGLLTKDEHPSTGSDITTEVAAMKLSRPVTRGSLIPWDKSLCIFCQKETSRETVLVMTNADAPRSHLLRLGSFHTALTFMRAIGKHMSDSGLAEVWTESVVFGENTAANNLLAKSCNHAVRAHKLTYEALLRILWPQFIE